MNPINSRGQGRPMRGVSVNLPDPEEAARHRPGGTEPAAPSPRGRQVLETVLKPEAAATLADLRERTGRTYSAIIEGLLLAERARDLRRGS